MEMMILSLIAGLVAATIAGIISGLIIGKEAIGAEVAGGLGGVYGFLAGAATMVAGLLIVCFII